MSGVLIREREIMPVMLGTAGHVDHGKTALVKLLTGCDTDLLPEEKKRGMSIDLGFAPFVLQDSRMVGIIDVPGHEDFIRNMVAGASSIDVLILVIAADDGVMPQTIEHLKIVSLLRTPKVMAVITKIDLATPERRREVKENAAVFLAEHGFPGAPVIEESNLTGEGIGAVREAINKLAAAVERPPAARAFRMDIERVFSIEGYGTVVTGIPSCGICFAGAELEMFPGPRSAVCRAIQQYGRESRHARAHGCSAINLRGVKAQEIERGMTLAEPGIYRETCSAVLSVRNVHDSVSIKRRQEMRFCFGTSNRIVSGLLAGRRDVLKPGETGFMQIKFAAPLVLAAGDRFILRSLSPSATVAGGVVLTINGDSRGKKPRLDTERLEAARAAAENNDPFLSELIAGLPAVISQNDLPRLIQGGGAQIKLQTDEKTRLGIITPLGSSHWVVKNRISELEEKLKRALTVYHKENKLSRGMQVFQVCALLELDNSCAADLSGNFAENRVVAAHDNYFFLKGFTPALTAKQLELKDKIVKSAARAGRAAIASNTLCEELGAASRDIQLLTRLLSEEGLITVIDRYLFHTSVVKECLDKLLELFKESGLVELNRFREATGLSRNLAVPILEHFDAKGITRREGKGRSLLLKCR